MKKVRWLLETALFIAVSFPAALLPYNSALKVGELLGLLLFSLWKDRRTVAADNIRRSMQAGALRDRRAPEEIARESFMNFGRSFIEVVRLYYGRGMRMIDQVNVEGIEHYRAARAKNRGVLIITGHCGNWELMALAFGMKVSPAAVVARVQNNPYLNRIIERVRARYGNSVIYKKGALKAVLSHLKKNGTVGILMDQAVVREEGYVIDFLGRGAWTTRMPALLARKTGAPVVPVFIHRNGTGHTITIYPELVLSAHEDSDRALIEDTKRFSGCIEDYIRRRPEEWLWIHKRWKRVDGRQERREIKSERQKAAGNETEGINS